MKSRGSPDSLPDVFEATGGSFLPPSELEKMEPLKRYKAARMIPRASTTTSEEGEAISAEGSMFVRYKWSQKTEVAEKKLSV